MGSPAPDPREFKRLRTPTAFVLLRLQILMEAFSGEV
jgi:hypothetical protein